LIKVLDTITEYTGRLFSWCTTLLVILICIDVFLRYALKISFIWLTEVEIYLFALTFLFGAAYALKHDKHVRVDIFYDTWSSRKKAWTNIWGGLFLLIPWCVVCIIASWKYFAFSFSFKENSPQAGGLPYLYVLKLCIVLGFIMLLLQGLSNILKSIQILKTTKEQ